jgi:hypothetical protein
LLDFTSLGAALGSVLLLIPSTRFTPALMRPSIEVFLLSFVLFVTDLFLSGLFMAANGVDCKSPVHQGGRQVGSGAVGGCLLLILEQAARNLCFLS